MVDCCFHEPLVDERYLILEDEKILVCFKPVLEKLMGMVESRILETKRKGGSLKVTTIFSAAFLQLLTRKRNCGLRGIGELGVHFQ
jgi:hypothetical protein